MVMVSLLRVNLAIMIACRAKAVLPVILFDAKASERSWIHALEADLNWIAQLAKESSEQAFAPLGNYGTIAQWFQAFRQQPIRMAQLIKRLCVQDAARKFGSDIRDKKEKALGTIWICEDCDRSFNSYRGM